MGTEGVYLPLIIGGLSAAAGAGGAAYSTVQQNQRVKAAKESAAQAARIQSEQVNQQTDIEKMKAIRRAEQIRGRLRLAGAEAGLSGEGSIANLEQQNEIDTGLNLGILDTNRSNTRTLIGSNLSAELNRLSGSYRNALLSGFEGALGGAQQGLAIGHGLRESYPETFGP